MIKEALIQHSRH